MTEDEKPPEIDLGAMRMATMAVAEMIYTYWQALMNGGVPPDLASELVKDYQTVVLAQITAFGS